MPLLTLAGVGARRAWVAHDRYGPASVVKPALLILTPVCLLQVYWTRLDFRLLLDNLVVDDTFLYLQIVRNVADRGMVSFDGIHSTTGFQPLWAILLVPLAVVIEDRVEFVRWVLLLSVFLNLAAGAGAGASGGHAGRAEFRTHHGLPVGRLHARVRAGNDWYGIALAGACLLGLPGEPLPEPGGAGRRYGAVPHTHRRTAVRAAGHRVPGKAGAATYRKPCPCCWCRRTWPSTSLRPAS